MNSDDLPADDVTDDETAGAVAGALAADRERWALALHDGAIQKLTVATLRAGLLRRRDLDPELADELEQLEAALTAGTAALREVLVALTAPPSAPHPAPGDRTDA